MKSNIGKFWNLLIVLMISSASLFSQSKLSSPSIKIDDGKSKYDLKLKSVEVNVKIIGSLAVTNIELNFFNESSRILEGELQFPLAENQTVSRFAMDINGKLREAVPVEKEKGRKTFEEIVRRGVDPALLEQTEGNIFRARVYPISANSSKKIVLGYEEQLSSNEDGFNYRLPLNYKENLEKFNITFQVFNSKNEPIISKNWTNDIKFAKENNSFVIKSEFQDFKADKQLEITIPSDPEAKSILIENRNGKDYFVINFTPKEQILEKQAPRKVVIISDISNSMSKREIDREQELLKAYFTKYNKLIVKIIYINSNIEETSDIEVNRTEINKIVNLVFPEYYDGASQLGLINLKNYDCDEFILLSDGISNFGKKELIIGDKPIYTINSLQNADHSYLQYLANISGGRYINLLSLNDEEALKQLTNYNFSFISADYNQSEIEQTYPSLRTPTSNNFVFTGILKSNSSAITLNFGKVDKILYSEKFELNKSQSSEQGGTIAKLWAKQKLAELNLRFEKNKEQITEIGKEYSIVTKNTSLIILETVEDYLRYDITPPEELLAEYNLLKNNRKRESTYLDSIFKYKVIKNIEDFKNWHSTDFAEKERLRIANEEKRRAEIESRRTEEEKRRIIAFKESLRADSIKLYNEFKKDFHSETTGCLKGIVREYNGSALAGATIKINNTKLGAVAKSDGFFFIQNIPPGNYDVKIMFVGVPPSLINNLKISKDSCTAIIVEMAARDSISIREILVSSGRLNEDGSYIGASRNFASDGGESAADEAAPRSDQRRESRRANIQHSPSLMLDATGGAVNVGEGFNVRGSRSSETQIRVDGLDVGNQFSGGSNSSSIKVNDYKPDAEYYKQLENSDTETFGKIYRTWKKEFENMPFFYIDAADIAIKKNLHKQALVIVSNLAEIDYENTNFLRILAARLRQMKQYELAIMVYREILKNRGEEPQSYRDLALTLADNDEYQESADLLYKIITSKWDQRFPGIEQIVFNELNNVIYKSNGKVKTDKFKSEFLGEKPLDVRIVMNWDADNTDIDLWVDEPNKERCMYNHNLTKIGGRMSRDFTQGYGPEEYSLKIAPNGKFTVNTNYYGSRSQKSLGPVTVYLELYTNYSKPNEKREILMIRLKEGRQTIEIGSLEFKSDN